jgi:predicted nucleic acid-binding protein
MSVVVDASVIIAMVVRDERQQSVQNAVERWIDAGEALHAPAVMPYEVASVLTRRIHDGDLAVDEATDIWLDVADLGVEYHPFDLAVDGPSVARITATLRRRHATDSTYVWLAQQWGRTCGRWTPYLPATLLMSACPSSSSPEPAAQHVAVPKLSCLGPGRSSVPNKDQHRTVAAS